MTLSSRIATAALAVCAMLVASACSREPSGRIDMTDPQAVAREFMDAYKTEDFASLVPMTHPVMRKLASGLLTEGRASRFYAMAYNESAAHYRAAYRSEVGDLRTDGERYGVLAVDLEDHEALGRARYFVIGLLPKNGEWFMYDFLYLDEAEWAAFTPVSGAR